LAIDEGILPSYQVTPMTEATVTAARHLLLLAGLLVLGSCAESTTAPDPAVVGEYTLIAVDGQPLPAFYTEALTGRLYAAEGVLLLEGSGTFAKGIRLVRGTPPDSVPHDTRFGAGTFTTDGNRIRLRETGGSRVDGTITGDVIRYPFPVGDRSLELTWRRRASSSN
jgi:hypothetical protein